MTRDAGSGGHRRRHGFSAHPHEVDLHAMGLDRAFAAIDRHLRELREESLIITGWGKHSPNNEPVLKPAIEAYLNRNGFWYEEAPPEFGGRGALLITRLMPGLSDDD